MKKLFKITVSCLIIACCFAFFSTSNLYAADKWWTVSVDTVVVSTSPSLQYKVKVTNHAGPWEAYLNFTNKEMLATALTAKSMDSGAMVKFDDSTYELLQIYLD